MKQECRRKMKELADKNMKEFVVTRPAQMILPPSSSGDIFPHSFVLIINKRKWLWILTNSLCLLLFFSLDRAQTTISFELCWSN